MQLLSIYKKNSFTDEQWNQLVTVFTIRNFTPITTTIMQIVLLYFPKSAMFSTL